MNDAAELTLEEREATLGGIGTARKRKEDARFIRGQGNFVDDVKLPGMVFGDFVRSPHAHARIKSIDTSAALAVPGVAAVVTAKDLEPLGLHWMPTLAGDVAAVLADKKVHFQNQEVAFVVGADRYAVADGIQAVEVEYEELPVLIDPKIALDDNAPILREDVVDKDNVGQGPRRHPNHIFTWEVGDADGTEEAFANAAVTIKEDILYPRSHPSPMETCGCVASMDATNGVLTVYGTFQAPHVIRTVVALITGLAESKIRIISPDVGGGIAVLGDDEGHLLVLEQDLLVGEHRLDVPRQGRHVVQVQRLEVVGRQHGEHPGYLQRRVLVDPLDPGVAVGGADEVAEHHPRQLDVVHVVALALGEPGVLDALARAAEALELLDALLGGRNLLAHSAASPAPALSAWAALISCAAASIALTMF